VGLVLRNYQAEALGELQGVYRSGYRRALLVAPTGSGKSSMVQHMLASTQMTTLILVHRQELLEMVSDSLPIRHGIIQPGKALPADQIVIGMMQTVSRRLAVLPNYQWVISDEAHLAMCPTWESILNHYEKSWHLGMSATPCRLDGKGLGAQYGKIVQGPTISELTTRGFLTPCRCYAPPPSNDAAAVINARSDSLTAQAELLDKAAITGDAIDTYRRLGGGKQGIVFCVNRKHAENVAAQFTMAGFPAVFVDGDMTKTERATRIAAFRARRYLLLVNVDLLTTGFDCPQIEVGIFLRRTDSLALFLQMVGRILRLYPGKDVAVLLDHVGNVLRHGLPAAHREWGLDGGQVRATAASLRSCPACYLAHEPTPRCPACGHAYIAAPKPRALAKRAGELQEVTETDAPAKPPLKERLRACRCKEDIYDLADELGYKPQWAFMQVKLRKLWITRATLAARQAAARQAAA
jgi:DNA repair protein RadD